MNDHLRRTLIGFIWPGPLAGPLPVNVFRILSPVLVFYLQPLFASVLMAIFTSVLAIIYLQLLELTGGKEMLEQYLRRLPLKLHRGIENKGPFGLLFVSLLTGVFPYAIMLKLLKYDTLAAGGLIILASIVSALLWTGLFWGSVVAGLKVLLFSLP